MKKLLLFFIFSGSMDSFSQVVDTTQPRQFDAYKWGVPVTYGSLGEKQLQSGYAEWRLSLPAPDTIRATLIVYYDRGPAILHTKLGYVVRKWGEEDVYLDDKKRVVKSPLEVFSYKLKK